MPECHIIAERHGRTQLMSLSLISPLHRAIIIFCYFSSPPREEGNVITMSYHNLNLGLPSMRQLRIWCLNPASSPRDVVHCLWRVSLIDSPSTLSRTSDPSTHCRDTLRADLSCLHLVRERRHLGCFKFMKPRSITLLRAPGHCLLNAI